MSQKRYWVYILASHKRTLYVGMTSNLERRIYEHRHKLIEGFTKRYNVNQLVYYEETNLAEAAIEREKQIKSWRREKKLDLIRSFNPKWHDFSKDILGDDKELGSE
jgi:putative endonuclease